MSHPAPPRRPWGFLAGALTLLLLLPLGALVFLRAPVEIPAPLPLGPTAVLEPERPVELRLLQLEGSVEIRGADGLWRAARDGEPLPASAAVRTGAGGRAVLEGEERYEVQLESGTEITVEELTSSISRLMLERGMATANVREGRHLFEVAARGSDAVARSDQGAFTVSNDGAGTVALATASGSVELRGGGVLVVVRAGQQSVVLAGRAPSEPAPIPDSLLLKVQWPREATLRRKRLLISGESEQGSRVEVAGRPLEVGEDGRFETEVELEEGPNLVRIRARAVGGAVKEVSRELPVDTTAPTVGLDEDLWTR